MRQGAKVSELMKNYGLSHDEAGPLLNPHGSDVILGIEIKSCRGRVIVCPVAWVFPIGARIYPVLFPIPGLRIQFAF